MKSEKLFGSKITLLGDDLSQTANVVSTESNVDINVACINHSLL